MLLHMHMHMHLHMHLHTHTHTHTQCTRSACMRVSVTLPSEIARSRGV